MSLVECISESGAGFDAACARSLARSPGCVPLPMPTIHRYLHLSSLCPLRQKTECWDFPHPHADFQDRCCRRSRHYVGAHDRIRRRMPGGLHPLDAYLRQVRHLLQVPTSFTHYPLRTSSAIGLVVQSTIWGMTLFKHVKVLVRNGWRNIPLLSLVTRDGSWAFVFLAGEYQRSFRSHKLTSPRVQVLLLSSMRDAISSLLLGYPNLNARLCRELMFP